MWRLFLISLLTACTTTPDTHFYSLDATANTQEKSINQKSLLIGVAPVSIPSILDKKQLVVTVNHRLHVAEFHQWLAPVKQNITEVITQNLAKLQPTHLLKSYPWMAFGIPNYRVVVDIASFKATLGSTIEIEAHWAIFEEKTHTPLIKNQAYLVESLGENYEDFVNMFNRLLALISQKIADDFNHLIPSLPKRSGGS